MMTTKVVQIPNQPPGTTIVVVNQSNTDRRKPHVKRGTTCCNGYYVSAFSWNVILTLGILVSAASLIFVPLFYLAFLGLPVGLFLIGLYIYFDMKAKREFDALPPNHPDRLKYCGYDITQIPINLLVNPESQVPPHPGQHDVFPDSPFPQDPKPPGRRSESSEFLIKH